MTKQAFVVRWKSPTMPAVAFWYYASREMAEKVAERFWAPTLVSVYQVEVSSAVHLIGEPY